MVIDIQASIEELSKRIMARPLRCDLCGNNADGGAVVLDREHPEILCPLCAAGYFPAKIEGDI